MLVNLKMDKAFELAEKYKGRDSYSEIYKAIKKLVNRCNKYGLMKKRFICCLGNHN